jgi:hypothetical protein
MSKMSRGLLEFMDRFALEDSSGMRSSSREEHSSRVRRAAVGGQF